MSYLGNSFHISHGLQHIFQQGWELTLPQCGIRRQTGSNIGRIAAVKRLLRLLRIQKVGRNRNIAGVDYLRWRLTSLISSVKWCFNFC